MPNTVLLTKKVSATATVSDSDTTATVIAAPGVQKTIYLQRAVVSVLTAGTGGTSSVRLKDGAGGDIFFDANADAVSVSVLDFGEPGYKLTENTLLQLQVSGAGTTQATVRIAVTAEIH